jgi:polar amino acid transport system substrate-binding protein
MKLQRIPSILLSLLLLTILILAACQVPGPPTAPDPAAPDPAVPDVSETTNHWSNIQAAGKIVVGTSADYPPFAYYTPNFLLNGFDVALMREVGRRLGVEVEFKDFAFEGLLDALTLNQFDAAIAAISITPEREAQVGFSRIYYVGEDAILTLPGSSLAAVRTAQDMAGRHVGVQNGSVYDGWAQRQLVETGLIQPEQIHRYGDVARAADDLRTGQIDLVMLDLVPAEALAQSNQLRIAGRGLVRQSFAIAVPKGDTTLGAQFNTVLGQLQEEGFIATLVAQYLAIEPAEIVEPPTPIPPTATPVPQATATPVPPTAVPTPACIDGMAFIQDLNYDDANMTAPPALTPGQGFTKSWRVQNTGTCAWPATYGVAYVGGNAVGAQMGGQPVSVGRSIAVNELWDISVNLIAPGQPGVYQGIWQMRNDAGVPFGQRMWVGIQIPGPPTATPVPPPPNANINFSADRTTINQGERVIFNWDVTGVKAVYFYEQGSRWEDNGVAGQGGREVWPQRTTVYELRVVKLDDGVEVRQIRIDVNQPVQPTPTWTPAPVVPIIYSFTANTNDPEAGSCVALRWDVGGTFVSIRLFRNGGEIMNNVNQRQYNDCQPNPGEFTYRLEVSNGRNTERAEQFVRFRPWIQPR